MEKKKKIKFDARIRKQGNSFTITIPVEVVKEHELMKNDLLRINVFIISCDKCKENCVDMSCKCQREQAKKIKEYKEAGL